MGANAQTTVPLFVANTVLTAAQQNISAGTGVPVFATTVTRDAAFGGANKALAEGQLCYVESLDVTQQYNGTAWANVGGKVLQVVQATTSTAVTTSSTSFVTSGLSASITPTLTTSKVLITTMQMTKQTGVSTLYTTLFRGTVAGTNLATGAIVTFGFNTVQSVENTDMLSMQFLDSPSTTSATTYTAGFKVDGNTGAIQFAGATSVMILMEIAA